VHSHAQFVQDEKDVKIAQLHYELVTLRMRLDTIRHEDLKQEIIMLEKEKLQLTGIWEAKIARLTEDNDEIIQSLQFRLRTREETIEMLEESLDLQLQKTAMAS
jgi:type II secretory pathway component PulJ